jgi:hypothetical protein
MLVMMVMGRVMVVVVAVGMETSIFEEFNRYLFI